jgi:toxin YoeB
VSYKIYYTKQSQKDAKKIVAAKLKSKVKKLLHLIQINPYENPPRYEKLVGDLKNLVSRRINIQHRLVYEVLEEKKIIKIIRMWTHYE